MPLGNAVQCPTGSWAQLVKLCEGGGGGIKTVKDCVTAINAIVLDDNPTTYTSAAIDMSTFDYAMLFLDIAVTSTPTDVLIEVLTSCDDSTYYTIMDGPLGDLRYDDTCCPRAESIKIPYGCAFIKVKATATGTDAQKTFTVTAKVCRVISGY